MTRTFVAAAMLLFSQAGLALPPRVDFNDSRAMDAIREANPAQYEKVMGILDVVSASPSCESLPQMLKVQYGATNVRCFGALIRTSYPAKRWFSFGTDDNDTLFQGNVVLTGKQPTLRPANNISKPLSHPLR